MGVRPLSFGNTWAYVAKMLPQLKCRTLNDADMTQFPFGSKKRDFKCDYRGFGGSEGRNVADFFGELNKTHMLSETKKICFMCSGLVKIMLFQHIWMIFAYITPIFVGSQMCFKIGFQ